MSKCTFPKAKTKKDKTRRKKIFVGVLKVTDEKSVAGRQLCLQKKYKIARIWIKAENRFGLCRESGEGNQKGFESRQVMIACPRVSELKVGLYCRVFFLPVYFT